MTGLGRMALWLSLVAAALFQGSAPASATARTDIDPRQDPYLGIRAAIERQLAAFNNDDTDLAFSFAAPNIQRAFKSPGEFASMVAKEYRPIHRSQGAVFLDLRQVRNHFVQRVRLMGTDGDIVEARYVMVQVNAGDWRIAGVMLDDPDFRPEIGPPQIAPPSLRK